MVLKRPRADHRRQLRRAARRASCSTRPAPRCSWPAAVAIARGGRAPHRSRSRSRAGRASAFLGRARRHARRPSATTSSSPTPGSRPGAVAGGRGCLSWRYRRALRRAGAPARRRELLALLVPRRRRHQDLRRLLPQPNPDFPPDTPYLLPFAARSSAWLHLRELLRARPRDAAAARALGAGWLALLVLASARAGGGRRARRDGHRRGRRRRADGPAARTARPTRPRSPRSSARRSAASRSCSRRR